MSCCGGETIQEVLQEMGVGMRKAPRDHAMDQARWLPVDPDIAAAIERLMRAWLLTPYAAGQRARKMGVDCAQLVPGFLDMAYGRTAPTPLPRQTGDAGFHSIKPGLEAIRLLRRSYPCEQIRDGCIEPGDVLVLRGTTDKTGPRRLGHAMIAGVVPGTAMHAVLRGSVCMTSITASTGIVRAYRMHAKESWVKYGR